MLRNWQCLHQIFNLTSFVISFKLRCSKFKTLIFFCALLVADTYAVEG